MPGFEDVYSVSSRGRVRRDVGGKGAQVGLIRRQQDNRRGYLSLNLSIGNKKWRRSVHRLVCEAFHGPPPTSKHTTNHKNGKKADNDESNLEWMTYSENARHAVATGLHCSTHGEAHYKSKLTEDDVKAIRLRAAEGHLHQAIADTFHISRPQISRIVLRKSWAWLK